MFIYSFLVFTTVVYNLQQEAPVPIAVPVANINVLPKPQYFNEEYHGHISHQEASDLLQKNGQYLVRESGKNRKHHTLSLKFNDDVKHFRY